MTMQRTLSILGVAVTACGTTSDDRPPAAPDADLVVVDAGTDPADAPGEPPDAGAPPEAPPDAGPPPILRRSCRELHLAEPVLDSGAYMLATTAGVPYRAYCDMKTDGGGWTLAIKVDGRAAASRFSYDSPLWTDQNTFHEDETNLDRAEAKLRAATEVEFGAIRLVMVETHEAAIKLSVRAPSLVKLMTAPLIRLPQPRGEWLALLSGAVVQPNCNQGGINNFAADPSVRVRIGMIANQEAICTSPDSFVGVGGGGGAGTGCYPPGTLVVPSAGSISGGICGGDNAPSHQAFAYVYVR